MKDLFFSGMSERQFIDFLNKAYRGTNMTDLEEFDKTAHKRISRKKGLLEKLHAKGIIIRSPKFPEAIKNLSDEELKRLVRKKYLGLSTRELRNKNSWVYSNLRERDLLEELIEERAITRVRVKKGFYKETTNDEIIKYTSQYAGKTVEEVKGCAGGHSLIAQLRERGIFEKAIREAGLVHPGFRSSEFKEMTDKELIEYIAQNHQGQTVTEIRGSNGAIYGELKRRKGIEDLLVKEGVVVKGNLNYKAMSNREFTQYVRENCFGITYQELGEIGAHRIWVEARERGLLDKLEEKGVLIRANKGRRFRNLEDEEFIQLVRKKYEGLKITELKARDPTILNELYRRNLMKIVVEEGVILKLKYSQGSAPDPMVFVEKDEVARSIASLAGITDNTQDVASLLVQMWPGRFPSAAKLAKSLPGAIIRIGKSLQPFTFQKASGLYNLIGNVPKRVYTALDDLLYNIIVDQYQIQFNKNPESALKEISKFSRLRGPVSKLAQKVSDYYGEVYQFAIPGYGKINNRMGA